MSYRPETSVGVLTLGAEPLVSMKSGPALFRGVFALIRCDGSASVQLDYSPSRSRGAVAQLGERCNRTAEVRGSIPLSSIVFLKID